MNKITSLVLFLLALSSCTSTSKLPAYNKELLTLINKNLDDAASQYAYLSTTLPPDKLPRSFDHGKLITSDSKWWCSGFYPGTLLYLYENNQNAALYNEAILKLNLLKGEQYNTTTHDLGFMMYCSYGNANRLQPNAVYKQILINGAKSLSTRFNSATGTIRSWDSKNKNEFLVIIDNMMNLELLFYATKVTGDSSYYKIAVTHADNTIKNHFRPDNSSYHVVNYNASDGSVLDKRTAQGAADGSAWARGQAWGFYGYTVMYRETRNPKYLEQATKIADFILNHPNLPGDKIPYWDFNAAGIPNALRDASAAAILASGLLEFSTYLKREQSKKYLSVAEKIIRTLSDQTYKSTAGENGGFLLKHSVGSIPHKSEVDVALSYADYYFVEAMVRYKRLASGEGWYGIRN